MDVKFTDNSEMVLSALERAKKNALTAIGMTAEGYAKKETPVDTGRLRNSMSNAVDGDSVYIGTNVEYAPYIEFGSIHNPHPAHMLQKAATQHTSEYKKIVKESLKNA